MTISEISNYFKARRTLPVISNVPRLINIIKTYFETTLYYQKNSHQKFYVQINGKQYKTQINGHDINNKPVSHDLNDISEKFITDVISDIRKNINIQIFEQLTKLLNSVLSTPAISRNHKLSIINSENKIFYQEWYLYVRLLPEKLAIDSLQIRKKFIYDILQSPKKYLPDLEHFEQNVLALHSAYEFYIKTLIKVHISKNHIVDILTSIYDELYYIKGHIKNENINVNRLITFLLLQLIMQNNLFQLEEKDKIEKIVNDYAEYIEKDKSNIIFDGMNFSPANFELDKFSIELVEPTFSAEDLDQIKTVISFVVPYQMNDNSISFELEDKTRIEFTKVGNLFDDPVFSFLDSTDININGMPLTFFSDSLVGNLDCSTSINIVINEFYHPDFELIDDNVVPKNFDKEEAKHGGRYYPHKDIILDKLWLLHSNKALPIDIERKDINSNFISNYLVSYFNKDQKLIHHKVFTITNFDSYFKAKNKFLENFNKLQIEEDLTDIRKFIFETRIIDRKSFLDFCHKFLIVTLKKSIELGGLHTAFWTEKDGMITPILEPAAQPIIYNLIRYLLEIKGIKASRETTSADGSLDFHFYYNKDDVAMNVCVELKNAHNGDLKHGITTQLPLYIEDIGNTEGIFLVLWYKSSEFNKPAKFNTVQDLNIFLLNSIPKGFRIKPLIIDCTKKDSPSKKSSIKRLIT